uniref:C2H2-type domain-containing protein n=1 Tax=Parascaris univalens TaxID=6257 RepID=A0A915BKB3_PARUN
MATSRTTSETETFGEELVLEMEQVVTEEELVHGLQEDGHVIVEDTHMEEIIVEPTEEINSNTGQQEIHYDEITNQRSQVNADTNFEETINETRYQQRHSMTRRSTTEQNAASNDSQNATRKRFTSAGGSVQPEAKVVVLMKSNAPGEKPTFVKLEPVTPAPTSRTVRTEFTRALTSARKSGSATPQPPKRKRRMIPPIVKKDHDEKKASSRRGRPRKSAVDTLHDIPLKKPKMEPPAEDGEKEGEQQQLTSSGRPKRTHKTPKRFGDFYEEPLVLRDPATIPIAGLEPEAEEDESGKSSPTAKRGSPVRTKKSVTANVVNEEDYDDEEDEDDEEDIEDEEHPEQLTETVDDEGEEGSQEAVKLQGKEYEDFVKRELSKGKLLCEQCHRFFANHNSMNAHRFKVHRVVVRASVKCPGCEYRATTIHTLNEHCATVHGLKLQFVRRKFNNTKEFQTYLDDLASTQNMAFVRHRKSANKRQLYCNRSGAKRVTSGDVIKNRPRKGSAKIGAMCPAHMFYTECDDGSVEVNGQITHFGHTLDPRFVFPVTSSEKVTGRMKPSSAKTAALSSMYGRIPVDLQIKKKESNEEDGFINVETVDGRNEEVDEEEEEMRRLEEEERLEEEFGPVHPKAEEIDIRMKNIDRLCSFLFDNVSEQLYRLDDNTMEVLLRSLRTTQNTVSNLNSMMIQIKDGDPEVIQKYQRRGGRGWSNIASNRVHRDTFINRRRQRQLYDTEDYDEDTVYYRHVPLRSSTELQNVFLLDEDDDEYFDEY